MEELPNQRWEVGATVCLKNDDRLMTVVKCHDDDHVSVAWFEQRKMHLERVPVSDIVPQRNEAGRPAGSKPEDQQ